MQHAFVIVGGGPVGLWTAIQLKKRQPHAEVKVYERHATYQRHHVLRLDHWSLLLYSRHLREDPAQDAFFRAVTDHSLAGITWRPTGSVALRTSDLETALETYAEALGVERVQDTIEDPHALMARHFECHHFIAADGARSGIRSALWPTPALEERSLQHIVELKYQVEGAVDPSRGRLARQAMNHLAFDHVGRTRAGQTPVTLRVFLDESEHLAIPPATFKAPLAVDDPALPPALAQDLLTYLQVRHHAVAEPVCRAHAHLTKLELSLYAATSFAQEVEGRAWYLVGDAALGVPYFRSLNSGLILGSRLAQMLAPVHWWQGFPALTAVQRYNSYRPWHVATEFGLALAKDAGINAYEVWRQAFHDQYPDARLPEEDMDWTAAWSPMCQATDSASV
jgi:2-polyprenyl-6-methoxyphenol hydroxylase-like FAD-dependent oxidoreductase